MGFWEDLFKEKKISIDNEVVLIRKRLGWIIFWLILIFLAVGNLQDLIR